MSHGKHTQPHRFSNNRQNAQSRLCVQWQTGLSESVDFCVNTKCLLQWVFKAEGLPEYSVCEGPTTRSVLTGVLGLGAFFQASGIAGSAVTAWKPVRLAVECPMSNAQRRNNSHRTYTIPGSSFALVPFLSCLGRC